MYRIDKTPYGFRLTFAGKMDRAEMAKWVAEAKSKLKGVTGKFGVFVDMRTLGLLDQDAQAEMKHGQVAFKAAGMQRSVVILANALLTMQFRRIGKETGIDAWERYIDASATPNFEQTGVAWLERGVEPS